MLTRETNFGPTRVQLDYRFHDDGSIRCITISPLTEGVVTGTGLRALLTEAEAAIAAQATSGSRSPGVAFIYTSALTEADAVQFVDAGFHVRAELALLTRNIERGLFGGIHRALRRSDPHRGHNRNSRGDIKIVRGSHDRIEEALEVDQSAFAHGWAMDMHDLTGALKATPTTRLHLALDGTTVVGFAVTGRANRRGYLQRLAVQPHFQGRGLGAALVHASIDWASSRDVKRLIVNTQTDNLNALRLYERAGFVRSSFGLVLLEYPLQTAGGAPPTQVRRDG